jgi:NADH:ubiquinone oxidoreductase subunit
MALLRAGRVSRPVTTDVGRGQKGHQTASQTLGCTIYPWYTRLTASLDDGIEELAKSGIKQFLTEIFSWWSGQTWGTRLWIWRFGDYVGSDEFGNKYYQDRKADRRYVTYAGYADASTIGQGWHGWMHHRTDVVPNKANYVAKSWELPHEANLTGTAAAYRPDGSLLSKGERPRVTGDYDAWSPE